MKEYSRRLEVTVSGRWYLALTILVGVAAITTGNNTIYIIESLLLSGLILSGILSEQTISSIDVVVRRQPAIAGSATTNGDTVIVHNRKNRHLFALEVGEWIQGKYLPLAWIPELKPRQTLSVPSRRVYSQRGRHGWDAIAIGTRYPFGLARKFRFQPGAGNRLVWPRPAEGEAATSSLQDLRHRSRRAAEEASLDEIRTLAPGDDIRLVIWTLSDKGVDPVVRSRGQQLPEGLTLLDRRSPSDADFELSISRAARELYAGDRSLVTLSSDGRQIYRGKTPSLDQLAIVERETPE